ncbi:GrpB family protein [Arthrobacter sp. UYEF20]|uniref:GrpB family protein n=1 Tax=Arthrobacter sp. UYEF20 TaxID=1756363 RepID=UPI003398C233
MKSEEDADLDGVLIGGREERTIVIVEYDHEWPRRFETLAKSISGALGEKALSVEHIGSTAVPRLAAKPIIDILLTVLDVDDEATYVPALENVGFVLRVREAGHRMLKTPSRDVNLHVFHPAHDSVPKYRDLRDWLCVDETDRALYADTKKKLSQRGWRDVNEYADAKTGVISRILDHARVWREKQPSS